jgi:predicted double-glycine peptidase
MTRTLWRYVSLYVFLCGPTLAYMTPDPTFLKPQPTATWKNHRDDGVVKQSRDYSCGSASLATILTYHYQDTVSEAAVMRFLARQDAASFTDLQRAAEHFGYMAIGLAANLDHLRRLKVPAILFLKIERREHFVVFRGINRSQIFLADPSTGNKSLSIQKFMRYWATYPHSQQYGRLLLVLPADTAKVLHALPSMARSAPTHVTMPIPRSTQRFSERARR